MTIRRTKSAKADDIDAAIARMQAAVDYRGPYISEAEWAASLDEMFEEMSDDYRIPREPSILTSSFVSWCAIRTSNWPSRIA